MRLSPLLALLAAAAPAAAQVPDTVDVDRLRREARAHRDSFPLQLALGQALARTASERESDWRMRAEAEEVLERAFRLRTGDPRPFLEIGLLRRKQGMRNDAMRVLGRAERLAEESTVQLEPAERAELHYQMGLIYETWWEDWANLGQLRSDFARGNCTNVDPGFPMPFTPGLVAVNFVCPDVYNEMMGHWRPIWDLKEAEFEAMIRHFRAALTADPSRVDAGLRLLRHLADGRRWSEYVVVARRLATRVSDDPWVLLFLGMGYRETGRSAQADSAFSLALARADSALRVDLLRPEQLLRVRDSAAYIGLGEGTRDVLEEVFWRARDPLYLTAENERLADHLARYAYVELAFSSPQSGLRGRWSDRGEAWMRYGRPVQVRVIQEEPSGRLEFWDYGPDTPDLVFRRRLTYRFARHEELSQHYAEYARRYAPELPGPMSPRIVAPLPFQAAAFRGPDSTVVLDVYAAVPALEESDLAMVEAGIFVVTGDFWEPRGAWRGTLDRAQADTPLEQSFRVTPGRYVVSAEAAAGDVAARRRARVEVRDLYDSPAVSDILLADRFGVELPRVDDRRHLAPVVSHTLAFPPDRPIGVVWEVYGLETDSAGVARYTLRLEVQDAEERSAVARAVRGLLGVSGDGTAMRWDVERAPRGDGTMVEFVWLDISELSPGPYRMFVSVLDRLTGRTAEVLRTFMVVPPTESP